MRFGVCAGVDKAELLASLGYDYIELSVAGDLTPDEDEDVWQARLAALRDLPLPPEAFNSFVRAGKIVGPEADPQRLARYVHTALQRAAEIGGKVIVFGSGGARNIPDGFDRARANQQLVDFLNLCADASAHTGVIVVIEPLQRQESNVLNLVSEAAEWTRRIHRLGVCALADTFHMERENEPMSAIVAARDVLAHAHTADTERRAPGTGIYDHVSFFGALRDAGYDERVSIECSWGADFAGEASRALRHLRTAYDAANNGDVEAQIDA